ncbi:uncharacterized protein LOC130613581 [Hydractinia symbiolongicarpus]|uniref:uncharacterized protein LOC130613581 n=1 Tax=Hydractinia symbiolongicarpus TaxID=13093 RepID=UPI00254A033E|nr:uncharacterized protein LOC130613581 [Hydractinia symbiolongicarpus]
MGSIEDATLSNMRRAIKVLQRAKCEPVELKFKAVGNIEEAKLLVFHDASFANLKGEGSQGGFLIFLANQLNQSLSLISWQSRKLKRVVNSTLSAETMQLIDAAGKGYWIRCLYEEIFNIASLIQCLTDSKKLYDAVHSTKQVLDKLKSRFGYFEKEMIRNEEVNQILFGN